MPKFCHHCRSVTQSCPALCNPIDCSMLGFPGLHHRPELAQCHVHWVSDTIQLSHPLSSPYPPTFNLSQHQGLFKWVSSSHPIRWPKYWSFSFSISPSNEYSVLISFRIDWFDLLSVQGTLKSVFQYDSSKASILQHSAFHCPLSLSSRVSLVPLHFLPLNWYHLHTWGRWSSLSNLDFSLWYI